MELSDQLTFDYKLEKVPLNNSSKLEISGVLVSIRPDIYLKDDNDKVVGYIKLHFPKTNPLTTISGEFVATALKTFLQNDSPSPIDPKLCVVVDIPSATVFSAPKAGKKRMTDLEAACEEISDRWQVKTS